MENRHQAEGPLGVGGALRDILVSNQILLVGGKAQGGENVVRVNTDNQESEEGILLFTPGCTGRAL